ncbi:MAG: glucose-1-phosphate adenylyltransferase subunit GlgD [Clostridia bacterium]|nr:glucose-1-phosphate adenylyltransferase subunit GlgD [Clostridia bacterium]
MRGNKVLGMIYASAYDQALPELTNMRTMGSVPFSGRYRLIDFALSNMVNSGISKVGVITKSNYRSLMDHLGTGKPWDLSRKREGMYILPPFNSADNAGGIFANRIDALIGCGTFISHSNKEYVLISDCNTVCNIDFKNLFDEHEKSGADITIAYRHGETPALSNTMSFDIDESGRVKSVSISALGGKTSDYSLNILLLKTSLLERLVLEAASMHHTNFERDIIQSKVGLLKIHGYRVDGFARTLDSLQSYYDINMELLNAENRKELFCRKRPVYTKVRDDIPAIYGLGSNVKNSLIADGCTIEGTVENSILFRGVTVGKDAVVKNSIVMQGSYIGERAQLNSVIMDKITVIKPGQMLCGTDNFPVYVGKGIVV